MNFDADDFEVIRAVIAGDRNAFGILVQRYQNMIFSLLLKKCNNYSTAEDLAQEVFIKAFKALTSFRFESSFSTWLVFFTNQYSSKSKKTKSDDELS